MSIDDYLTTIKMLVDNVKIVRHLILDKDLMIHVLTHLGLEYDLVMVNITSKTMPITWQEAQVVILN